MAVCCCALAGTVACFGCPNAPMTLYQRPAPTWTYAVHGPIDYEKLAELVAERLAKKQEAPHA